MQFRFSSEQIECLQTMTTCKWCNAPMEALPISLPWNYPSCSQELHGLWFICELWCCSKAKITAQHFTVALSRVRKPLHRRTRTVTWPVIFTAPDRHAELDSLCQAVHFHARAG